MQLQVGAILMGSWGYDQTNIDFFRVEQVNKGWAVLQDIESVEASDGPGTMTGKVLPVEPPRPVGKPFRRKVGECMGEPCLKITSYEYARPWDGKPKFVSHYA